MITISDTGTQMLATAVELEALGGVVDGIVTATAEAILTRATAMIETLCGRALHQQTVVETFRPDDAVCRLMVWQWPITTMTSIVENGTTLSASDYELDGSLVYRLSSDDRTSWPSGKIVLTYTAGYTTDTCPPDLKQACLDIAVNIYAMQGRDQTMRSITIPDVEIISYRDVRNGGSIVPDSAMAILDGYKAWRA